MKKTILTLTILALALTFANDLQARGRGACDQQGKGRNGACLTLPAAGDLSDAEAASLRAMRLEEKLARDVYLTLGQTWDEPAFTNIPNAEGRHMSRVAMLLERYGLEDPVTDDAVGAFPDPAVQALYDEMTARGKTSRVAALQVGAEIEDLDIHDLQLALDGPVDNADIVMVYENLQRGSRNHLRAFAGRLKALDAGYEAKHLSADAVAQIVASPHERGGNAQANAQGQGRGKGRGKGQGRMQDGCQKQAGCQKQGCGQRQGCGARCQG